MSIFIYFFILDGKNKEICLNFIGGDATLYVGPKLQFKLHIRPFAVQMDGCDEGFGILHHSVMYESKIHFGYFIHFKQKC